MLKKVEKYDPKIYGELRAKYLKSLDPMPFETFDRDMKEEEKKRQQIIKEIREGQLTLVGH